jgi:hypothetical protein
MDARELFSLRYDDIHEGFVDALFVGISDGQIRARPHGVNSIVWLVWHFTRIEDAVVSRLVADQAQVLEEGDWNRRMAIERRDVGSGMSAAEVDALSARIEATALRGYRRAVTARTKAVVATLPAAAWDEPVSPERVHREVAAHGLLVDAGRGVEEFWAAGRTRGWCLLQVGLLHPYGHCFDGLVTRGLLGVGDG